MTNITAELSGDTFTIIDQNPPVTKALLLLRGRILPITCLLPNP
ncbi:MAG: hypothetical protein ABF379_16315 [Akkermansiaceae bacterium]